MNSDVFPLSLHIRQLAANPKTASLLSDPAFSQKLRQMAENPQLAASALSDPRMSVGPLVLSSAWLS